MLSAVFSSAMLAAALPNEIVSYGVWALGFVALVPILTAVYSAPTWKHAARVGAVFGGLSTALSNYWLGFFGEFSVWTIGGTVIGYVGYNYILFGYLFHLSKVPQNELTAPPDPYRALRVALAWTGYEYFKSVGFLGYPWGLIAYPLGQFLPAAQVADIFGVWGLSFVGAYFNAAVAEVVYQWRVRKPDVLPPSSPTQRGRIAVLRHPTAGVLAAAAVFLVCSAYGVARLNAPERPTTPLRILLVQQNRDSWAPGDFAEALSDLQRLTSSGLDDCGSPDLIVWSETSLRYPYQGVDWYNVNPRPLPFKRFVSGLGSPLLTGAPIAHRNGRDFMNGALLIEPGGAVRDTYAKRQLVPFAESIPFWNTPVVQAFFETAVGLRGTWVPGDEFNVLTVPGKAIQIGTPICFEDAFGYVGREFARAGADLQINLTNNSWSRQDSAQIQHFVAARFRAIETRLPLVRGTNSGLTTVVFPTGRVGETLPMFTADTLCVTVPVPAQPVRTLYLMVGDVFGRLAAVATILLAAWYGIRMLRNRRY